MSPKNKDLTHHLFCAVKLPCTKIKIKKNKNGSFNLSLSGISENSINRIFEVIGEHKLSNSSVSNSNAPVIQMPNPASPKDLFDFDLDGDVVTIQDPESNTDNIHINSDMKYNHGDLHCDLSGLIDDPISQILFVRSTCELHHSYVQLSSLATDSCLMCKRDEILELTQLLSKLKTTTDFSEYAKRYHHLHIRNQAEPDITDQQVRTRYRGAIHYQLKFLNQEITKTVSDLFRKHIGKISIDISTTDTFAYHISSENKITLTIPCCLSTDTDSLDLIVELLNKVSGSSIPKSEYMNEDVQPEPCFRCAITPVLDAFNSASKAHANLVEQTPFSHTTPIEDKRNIQKKRQPLKDRVNQCSSALYAELQKFSTIITNPHPKQCLLKIDPITDFVRYKSAEGHFVNLKVPCLCNPSNHLEPSVHFDLCGSHENYEDMQIPNQSARTKLEAECGNCLSCRVGPLVAKLKKTHNRSDSTNKEIQNIRTYLHRNKNLGKYLKKEKTKELNNLINEKSSFHKKIKQFQNDIFQVLQMSQEIKPPHPTRSHVALLKQPNSISYTSKNAERIRLTIPEKCKNLL